MPRSSGGRVLYITCCRRSLFGPRHDRHVHVVVPFQPFEKALVVIFAPTWPQVCTNMATWLNMAPEDVNFVATWRLDH